MMKFSAYNNAGFLKSENPIQKQSSVRFCTNCGKPLEKGDVFCDECGNKIEQEENSILKINFDEKMSEFGSLLDDFDKQILAYEKEITENEKIVDGCKTEIASLKSEILELEESSKLALDEKNSIVYLKLAELYEKTEGIVASIEILKRGLNFGGFKEFEEVLAVSDDGKLTVNPQGASVEATVEAHGKDKKIIVYKYKPKKGYHKKQGHRQPYTKVKIEKINL